MKYLLILITVLAVASAKSIDIDSSQVLPIESIGIDWSQVRPIEDSDQYWARLPEELQYLREQQPDRRIVNGQEATPGQFPYQVLLNIQKTPTDSSRCGGSILSTNFVLTAAHCVWRAYGGTAVVGAHNRMINEPTQQRIPFEKVYYHAKYDDATNENDIAIVRLSGHMTFNDRVQPVRLPARGDNRLFVGLTATVSGWGNLCYECDGPDVLRYTSNPIVPNSECLKYWPSDRIKDSSLCMSIDGERGSCQGDSGGPVTVVDGGSPLQIGIVSFGRRCVDEFPKVKARVTYFIDWILHVVAL